MMSRKTGLFLLVLLLLLAVGAGLWLALRERGDPAPAPVGNQLATPETPASAPVPEPETNQVAAAPQPDPLPNIAGRTETVSCRQGECAWQRILRFERVRTVPQGDLRRIVSRRGFSGDDAQPSDVNWEEGEETSYVFCSRERPAHAFPGGDGSGLIIHYLDLFDLAGYQYGSAMLYMRACHGRDFSEDMDLGALGYRRGTRNEQVENGSPEDMTRF